MPQIHSSLILHDLCHSVTSDHCFIEFVVRFFQDPPPSEKCEFTYRDFKSIDLECFCSDVIGYLNLNVDFYSLNVEDASLLFNNALSETLDKHAPLLTISAKRKKTPFTNDKILELRRKRRQAERQYRKYGNPEDASCYKALVKDVQKLVKKTRNDFYMNRLAECDGDKKKQFKLFNKMLGKTDKRILPECRSKQQLCEEFQDFFSEKILKIRNEICVNQQNSYSELEYTQLPFSGNSLENFTTLTDELTSDTLLSLPNKYCCLDVVPTDFMKKCLPYLLEYLKYIINQSLETGIFPSKYKDTILKPSIKDNSVDKDLHCNYRPLSNLCFISKVMERSVLNQLVEHLQTNNLFGEFQSAYRSFIAAKLLLLR